MAARTTAMATGFARTRSASAIHHSPVTVATKLLVPIIATTMDNAMKIHAFVTLDTPDSIAH